MWGAHEVDGRIAAKNATKIRAALRQSVNAKSIYEQYQLTQPNVSDNVTQDRARARAWSLMNILFNNEALRAALLRLYAEAWVTGDAAAGEAIGEERELKKALEGAIDWSKWQPGDAAAAMLLDPPKAFEQLVTSSGSLIRGLDKTGYELVGTALADSIRAGYSPTRAAKLIQDAVGSPARALTIAVTESSRVMNASAINRYREAGIDKAQWMVVFGGGACEKCAQNAGKIVMLGGTYPSGNTQPPAHPHCRCNLRPVVPDYNEMFDESGNLIPLQPNNNGVSDVMADNKPKRFTNESDMQTFAMRQQGGIPRTENAQRAIGFYQGEDYVPFNEALRKQKPLSDKYALNRNLLDTAIKRSSFDTDVMVYRGITDIDDSFKNLAIGTEVSDLAYASTTLNPVVAEAFASGVMLDKGTPVIMEIIVPKGTPALAADVVTNPTGAAGLTAMEAEMYGYSNLNEVVLQRNTKMKITGKRVENNALYLEMTVIPK
jgi:SPP1 gp7 family putative phage head morphogenesis protein